MNHYNSEQIQSFGEHRFHFLLVEEKDHTLYITLNREDKKNALHPQMVNEIAYAFQYAHDTKEIRVVVLAAKGAVFCSGADLQAAMGMAAEHRSTIPEPQSEVLIGELFEKVHKPVVCVVKGNVYAGGMLLLAGSHFVYAANKVLLGLPEVKRGLFPYQVMASLMKVMSSRKVIDWCTRGYTMTANEAQNHGLVTMAVEEEMLDREVELLINELRDNSPTAIRMGLEAFEHIRKNGPDHLYLMEMLTKTISTKDGMEGMQAFLQKRKPVWKGE
jgi:enoyl-CoA hydratase/carnithine racemase